MRLVGLVACHMLKWSRCVNQAATYVIHVGAWNLKLVVKPQLKRTIGTVMKFGEKQSMENEITGKEC